MAGASRGDGARSSLLLLLLFPQHAFISGVCSVHSGFCANYITVKNSTVTLRTVFLLEKKARGVNELALQTDKHGVELPER